MIDLNWNVWWNWVKSECILTVVYRREIIAFERLDNCIKVPDDMEINIVKE